VRFHVSLFIGLGMLFNTALHGQQVSDAEKKRQFLKAREEMRTIPLATPAQQTPATPAPAGQSAPSTSSATPPAATPNGKGAAATADSKTSGEGLPVAVGRALDKKKVVVLLFWNRPFSDPLLLRSACSGGLSTMPLV